MMMRFPAVVVLALLATSVWAAPSPAPTTPNVEDSTTTNYMTAPAPLTSSSARATTSFYKPQGTCCKVKNWTTGECESIQATDNALWLSHTPEGSDTWCGVDECACGRTNSCADGAQNCGYNNPETDLINEQCICAVECFSKGGCCNDFQDVCSATTPDSVPPAPAPGGPTTSSPPAGTTNTDSAVSTLRAATLPPPPASTTTLDANATNTLDPADNTVVIVASVSVVVVIVIVVLVIFTVRHIKKKRAEDKPLFAASTTNYVGPQDGPSSHGSPGGESVGSTGGPAAVEPAGRANVYQSSRGTGSTPSRRSKSSKKSKKKSKKSTRSSAAEEDPAAAGGRQRTPAAADRETGGGGGGASASSRGSSGRRSRRSPSKGKSKSPASTTPHAHDDVFASPTHHNFEL